MSESQNKNILLDDHSPLTPKTLFSYFRKNALKIDGVTKCLRALNQYKQLSNEDRLEYLGPTIKFLRTEKADNIRSWGTNVLEFLEDSIEKKEKSGLDYLVSMINNADIHDKVNYQWTRFYGLRAIKNIVSSDEERDKFHGLCKKIAEDEDELIVRMASWSVLSELSRDDMEREYKEILLERTKDEDYWTVYEALRVLSEFPNSELIDRLVEIVGDKKSGADHRIEGIKAIGAIKKIDDISVIRGLGNIILTDSDRGLRLETVIALGDIANEDSVSDLIRVVREDEDAEIKVQATYSLQEILEFNDLISIFVQEALKKGLPESDRDNLIEAIRRIDPDRSASTSMLDKELVSDDQDRVKLAETILINLGGWAAVQRLTQRQNALRKMDELLTSSEEAVQDTFQKTIKHARLNFRFALIVNGIVVTFGICLFVVALFQMIQTPEKLESWLLPGGTGLISILINIMFNNPRTNAREDLGTLMNITVIFLGFIRQLNEVDATFKHAYIEDSSFGIVHMKQTVKQIDDAMTQTLEKASTYLYIPKESKKKTKVSPMNPKKNDNQEDES